MVQHNSYASNYVALNVEAQLISNFRFKIQDSPFKRNITKANSTLQKFLLHQSLLTREENGMQQSERRQTGFLAKQGQ